MIPAKRLLYVVLLWLLLGFFCYAGPQLLPQITELGDWLALSWYVFGILLLLLALFDGLRVRRQPPLLLERQLATVCPVDRWLNVVLLLRNVGTTPLKLALFDDYPNNWELQGLPFATQIEPDHFLNLTYQVKPSRRGDAQFGLAFVKLTSPFGLWQYIHRIGHESVIKVFPDYAKLLGQSLNATDRRANSAGIVRKRRRGEGTDFRQLREYRQGDSLRAIDWKATARYQKPITREYQEERDQQVVFLLDTGRRMLAKDGDTSHLDHALNAVITLSFIVQKQGDAVGLMCFGGENRWISPQKGRLGLDRILAGIYDLQAQEIAPDYTLVAQNLLGQLHKRAFVVLITNLRDEDDQALRSACEYLSVKHLVMCASLREKALDQAASIPVQHFDDALRVAGTKHYLQQRQEAIKRLGIRPHHLIDIVPQRLSASLVSRYLDIKESGQL